MFFLFIRKYSYFTKNEYLSIQPYPLIYVINETEINYYMNYIKKNI